MANNSPKNGGFLALGFPTDTLFPSVSSQVILRCTDLSSEEISPLVREHQHWKPWVFINRKSWEHVQENRKNN